jgi:hypothetical protein
MLQSSEIDLIHIVWEGPLSIKAVLNLRMQADYGHDYGLYQIYGTHSIFGQDALLYLGHADERTFMGRLPWYGDHWEQHEADQYQVYLGRFGGWEPIDDRRWGKLIHNAKVITVYNVSPPYNRTQIVSMDVKEPTVILNYEKRHRLPKCISNLDALRDINDGFFKLYGPPARPIPTPEAAEDEWLPT